MSVLIVCGSPRKNSNTEQLLSIFEKELQRNDIKSEFVTLAEKKIKHCINCDQCKGSPTSLLMAFIQRLTYVSYNNNHPLAKKIGGAIAIAGESGQLTTINCLTDFYLVNEMIIPSSNYWNIGTGVQKGDILNDKKGQSYVKKFAKNVAWVIKKLKEEN